jgi:hypothetical protein
MTEADWLQGGDLAKMLRFVNYRLGVRRARLAAVAWCRRVAHLYCDARCRKAWEAVRPCGAEDVDPCALDAARADVVSFLDYDPASYEAPVEAAHALYYALSADFSDPRTLLHAAEHSANARAHHSSGSAVAVLFCHEGAWLDERAYQCDVLRDIAGDPFRPPPPLAPAVLAWGGELVVRLAQAAYEDRVLPSGDLDPARLAVLADALEDAGCTEAELLGHLRGRGPHVPGCWAVDSISGRA